MAEHNPPDQNKVSFKDTLNLPHTDFPIRANAAIDDVQMVKRWQEQDLFTQSFEHNAGSEKYILHDGPPYANGNIHIGHAYNKILKDITTKAQRMMGKHVPVTPGWDCHGLPIELKVTQENPGLKGAELKKACRVYAQKWIDVQREEFKRLGVLMDWDRPYLTMDFEYEAAILRAFGNLVDAQYIERKNKTVPWCMSCQTVLATAEIEYQDRKDPSIYVLFQLEQAVVDRMFKPLEGKPVNILIWTTTPWTLPLNRAVTMRPQADYAVLNVNGVYVTVGKQLADSVCALLGVEKQVVAEFVADELVTQGARAHHPFIEGLIVPLLLDQSVLLQDGTAFVHCAPGAGPEDYEIGVRNKLPIYSPVGPDGKYTDEVMPTELVGMSVNDGQIWVIKKLAELNRLLFKQNIKHSYPHCWRCHHGLIFRATKQWFCDLSKNNLKNRTLNVIDTIETVPEKSISRLKATIEGRLEWCLSRQRVWGVSIPAIICTSCDYTHINKDFVDQVASQVAQFGIEYWDTATLADLLPKNFACPKCAGTHFAKEHDILDVWFDSGVSHYAVLKANPALAFPADIYLEGKDQHRGWFQSSLLTSMILNDTPPMKTIMTHGFTVDAHGHKMSKSIGNVVAPQQMIDTLGTDGLRLWASSIDCSGDAVISETLVKNVQEVFRKIRNTCRFLLSNLYDFDIERDVVALEKLSLIDQYALQELYRVNAEVIEGYNRYDFTAIFHILGDYCSVELSSFYVDIVKDRLYVEKANGHERRGAQTACWYILDTLTRLMAPILSFTAEQVSDYYQKDKKQSIHLQQFNNLSDVWEVLVRDISVKDLDAIKRDMNLPFKLIRPAQEAAFMIESISVAEQYEQRWEMLRSMRSAILKAIEQQREQNIIKHSLEASMQIYIDSEAPFASLFNDFVTDVKKLGQAPEQFFKEFVIVSDFKISSQQGDLPVSSYPGLYVVVSRATGIKCPRCWQWQESTHEHGLCDRCQAVLK